MNWIRNWWYKRLRKLDMKILWPTCLEHAQNLDDAKAAFACHAFHDEAWTVLGRDEVYRIIDGLGK